MRMGYLALREGDAHAAGREVYEGDSDDEDNAIDNKKK